MAEGRAEHDAMLAIFGQFSYTRHLSMEEKTEIMTAAVRIGQERAVEIADSFGGLPVKALLSHLKLRVMRQQGDKGNPDYVTFAQYYSKRGVICLNADAVAVLGRVMKPELAEDIICLHELYHYFEMNRWGRTEDLFVRLIPLFQRFPVRRKMMPAREIAANAFTREYLKLDFEPVQLDRLYFEQLS